MLPKKWNNLLYVELHLETFAHIYSISHLTPALVPQIDGTAVVMSMLEPSATAESSSTSPTMNSMDLTIHHQGQESFDELESPQHFPQMDGLVPDIATQRSEAILREAGSPETNVFYEQVRLLSSLGLTPCAHWHIVPCFRFRRTSPHLTHHRLVSHYLHPVPRLRPILTLSRIQTIGINNANLRERSFQTCRTILEASTVFVQSEKYNVHYSGAIGPRDNSAPREIRAACFLEAAFAPAVGLTGARIYNDSSSGSTPWVYAEKVRCLPSLLTTLNVRQQRARRTPVWHHSGWLGHLKFITRLHTCSEHCVGLKETWLISTQLMLDTHGEQPWWTFDVG